MIPHWKLCLVINAWPLPPFCHPIVVSNPIRLEPPAPHYVEFEGAGLHPEDIRTIHTLAAIDRLSESLPADAAQGVQQSVAAHMEAIGHKLGPHFALSRTSADA